MGTKSYLLYRKDLAIGSFRAPEAIPGSYGPMGASDEVRPSDCHRYGLLHIGI